MYTLTRTNVILRSVLVDESFVCFWHMNTRVCTHTHIHAQVGNSVADTSVSRARSGIAAGLVEIMRGTRVGYVSLGNNRSRYCDIVCTILTGYIHGNKIKCTSWYTGIEDQTYICHLARADTRCEPAETRVRGIYG